MVNLTTIFTFEYKTKAKMVKPECHEALGKHQKQLVKGLPSITLDKKTLTKSYLPSTYCWTLDKENQSTK
jgi:hypothetical protein